MMFEGDDTLLYVEGHARQGNSAYSLSCDSQRYTQTLKHWYKLVLSVGLNGIKYSVFPSRW